MRSRRSRGGPPATGAEAQLYAVALLIAAVLTTPAIATARADVELDAPVWDDLTHWDTRTDTLWIFDADFEDLLGDNDGWESEDWSPTAPCTNYWHKDTIHMWNQHPSHPLGDSTWWCGTYDNCWVQPRGYGNNWTCILSRSFPELVPVTQPGDALRLEFDQRFAIEPCYDCAYVDVSTDGGATWATVDAFHNASCWTSPGMPLDWDGSIVHIGAYGHMEIDLSEYAGEFVDLRFRFESDPYGSSQDYPNNPGLDSLRDGAWQIDNIAWHVNDELVWLDDCESPGPNGWVAEDMPGTGQTGVVYRRSFEEFDGHSGWMMAAYDSVSGAMVTGQHNWLYSPPIFVAGAMDVVVQWEGWVDLPDTQTADRVWMKYMVSDSLDCLQRHLPRIPYTAWSERGVEPPEWAGGTDTLHAYDGEDWLVLALRAWSWVEPNPHGVGIAFDRIRVGIPGHTGVPDGSTGPWVSDAYPNPLGPTTTVHYLLPSRSRVNARVYDLSGRLVRSLVDEVVEPGVHRVVWDGTTGTGNRAASGVYFLKVEAGGVPGLAATRKLVLLK